MAVRLSSENGGATPAAIPSVPLIWPIPSIPRIVPTAGGKCFGRDRRSQKEKDAGVVASHHPGIDLIAPAGDPIVAPQDGIIKAFWYFYNGTCALTFETAEQELVFGEVAGDSLQRLGFNSPACYSMYKVGLPGGFYPKQQNVICGPGSQVSAGQVIAYVGLMSGGSHMLHFEIYRKGKYVKGGGVDKWYIGQPAPSWIRDPTPYLLACQAQASTSALADAKTRARIEATSPNSTVRRC